jgi:hypothetical protein
VASEDGQGAVRVPAAFSEVRKVRVVGRLSAVACFRGESEPRSPFSL